MKHALVVGGSGMLAGACAGLVARGWCVSVVARNRSRLARLGPGIDPISVDYTEHGRFRAALTGAIERHGPIELMVCWIRSYEPEALRVAASMLSPSGRLVHVLGSGAMADAAGRTLLPQLGSRYARVVLGGGSPSRWLTHAEISAGVLDAVDRGAAHHVVGVPR